MSEEEMRMKVDADVLVRFIEITKDGKYAPIAKDSLKYARIRIEAQPTFDVEEQYYYSIS